MPYKDPQRNKDAARDSMRRSRATLRTTRELAQLVSGAQLGPIRDDALSRSTSMLAGLMVKQGLTTESIIDKVKQAMEAKTVKAILENREELPDNDAQLKATELAIDLQVRAGLLPSDKQHNGSGNITLNVISYTSAVPDIISLGQVIDTEVDK